MPKTRTVLSLTLVLAMLMFAFVAVSPSAYAVNIPPPAVVTQAGACGNTVVGNVLITGPQYHLCATSPYITIGAASVTVTCSGPALVPMVAGVGIGIYNPGYPGVTIKNCTLKGFQTGIELVNAVSNGLQLDTAKNSAGDGFLLTYGLTAVGAPGICSQNTLTLDKALSNGGDGFYLNFCSGDIFAGDSSKTNNASGFATLADSADFFLLNTATANHINGFSLTNSTNEHLDYNHASTNSLDGFLLNGTMNSFLLSNLADGSPPAIAAALLTQDNGFTLLNANYNNLVANTALYNKDDGFNLTRAGFNSIITNTAADNGHDGFELTGSNANNLATNTAKFNTNDGIDLNGGSGVTAANWIWDNKTPSNGVLERADTSVGGGTAGTANWWILNTPAAPTSPPGI